jgi:hypothetical protein
MSRLFSEDRVAELKAKFDTQDPGTGAGGDAVDEVDAQAESPDEEAVTTESEVEPEGPAPSGVDDVRAETVEVVSKSDAPSSGFDPEAFQRQLMSAFDAKLTPLQQQIAAFQQASAQQGQQAKKVKDPLALLFEDTDEDAERDSASELSMLRGTVKQLVIDQERIRLDAEIDSELASGEFDTNPAEIRNVLAMPGTHHLSVRQVAEAITARKRQFAQPVLTERDELKAKLAAMEAELEKARAQAPKPGIKRPRSASAAPAAEETGGDSRKPGLGGVFERLRMKHLGTAAR